MSKEEFIIELAKNNIILTEEQKNQLDIYKDFLQEYNKHTNLTRIINDEEIYLKHFFDSLTIAKYVEINKYESLLDIGTGAGFPGMVLKIVFPHLNVTLLDSNNKKAQFLKELSDKLNINVRVINQRAEEYILNQRESFDLVVSRAVAQLNILLELTIPFVKVGGLFIAMKSNVDEELEHSKNTPLVLGAKLESINKFNLVKEDSLRTILIYNKNNNTNSKYPRKYDVIKKKPII